MCQLSCVKCQVSGVMCHMLCVTCHMSLMPPATATDPPLVRQSYSCAGLCAQEYDAGNTLLQVYETVTKTANT